MLQQGELLENTYQIINRIGSGGTGDVYLAYHTHLCKYVVVKKIKDSVVSLVNVRAEVDILKRLKHTYLPQVYDFVQRGNQVYTVMDYIEGTDLAAIIASGQLVDEATLLKWLRQLCEVLEYLHSQKPPIIHSDIKPANIMITRDNNVCLIDFNISLGGDDSTQITGISLPFASPEQYMKARLFSSGGNHRQIVLDGRSDMYSLGASFYNMMTLTRPSGPNQNFVYLSQWRLPYSGAFVAIVEKAMNPDINKRYASMSEMLKDINRMYRKTGEYRLYLASVIGAAVLYAVTMFAGIMMIVHGSQLRLSERYQTAHYTLASLYSEGAYQETVTSGEQLLQYYHDYLRKRPDEMIWIYSIMGESCYELADAETDGDYSDAAYYYSNAVQEMDDLEQYKDCYYNYIIALVKTGDIEQAEQALEELREAGIWSADGVMTELELMIYHIRNADEGYSYSPDEVYAKISQALNSAISDSTKTHILALAAEYANSIDDYTSQISYLEQARNGDESTGIIRKLGNAYFAYAQQMKEDSYRRQYLQKALECYTVLTDNEYATVNDYYNLEVCYYALGAYEDCVKIFEPYAKSLTADGKEDYRIFIYLAFSYNKLAAQDSSLYDQTYTYARKAYDMYTKISSGNKLSEGSQTIQNLIALVTQLEDQLGY